MNKTQVDGLEVLQFTWDVYDSNTYVVQGESSLFVVDPVDSDELHAFVSASRLGLQTIVLTHCHFDHISGLEKLRRLVGATTVYATEECSKRIQKASKNLSNVAEALAFFMDGEEGMKLRTLEPFEADRANVTFTDALSFIWEGHAVELRSFKGHTSDGLVCRLDEKCLFTGDTLLPIPTITRFPSGSTKRFWNEDVPKFEELVGRAVAVFPGHGSPGKLEDMLAVNMKNCILTRRDTTVHDAKV